MIIYVTTRYKWDVFGVTRAYYGTLIRLGHQVELQYADKFSFSRAMRPDVKQIWFMYSGHAANKNQIKALQAAGKKIVGFSLTGRKGLHHKESCDLTACATIEKGTLFLPPAMYTPYHMNLNKPRTIAVSYIGSTTKHRLAKKRLGLIKQLKAPVKVFTKKVTGERFRSRLNSIKIGLELDSKEDAFTIPHRVVEMAACGVLCMVPDRRDLKLMFEPGKEVVVYENLEDLDSKIWYYLRNNKERASIVRNCIKRCYKHHTSIHRVNRILEALCGK